MLVLFLLKRTVSEDGNPEFDATHGFVIAASDEQEARQIASDYREVADDRRHRDDECAVWQVATTTCEIIGHASENVQPGVILEDHQWG